eukprot:172731-Pyramimonas_sp.AAC.1
MGGQDGVKRGGEEATRCDILTSDEGSRGGREGGRRLVPVGSGSGSGSPSPVSKNGKRVPLQVTRRSN